MSIDFDHDVFISHASEDKESIVRPLAHALREAGVRVWFDEHALTLGDSLRAKIDEGLARSRFGVVVLSESFFAKDWPKRELDGLVARESEGRKVILPIWHELRREDVIRYSPTLAGKLAVSSERGIPHVVKEIQQALAAATGHGSEGAVPIEEKEPAARPGPSPLSRVLYEPFDSIKSIGDGMQDIWLTEQHPQWATTIEDGELVWTNESSRTASLQSVLRYSEHGEAVPMRDAVVKVKVRVGPPNDAESGAGLLFRYESDRGYVLLLQRGDAVTLFEREGGSMRRGPTVPVTPDESGAVTLCVEGDGTKVRFSANESATQDIAARWPDGSPGLMAYGTGGSRSTTSACTVASATAADGRTRPRAIRRPRRRGRR